jgi:hypothetical protein
MISWGVIGYGAVLSALLAGLLVAAATRTRRLAVGLAAALAAAAGPIAWNAILRATHAGQFFHDAPIVLLPASWQDTGSGVFAIAAAGIILGLGPLAGEPARRVIPRALLAGLAAFIVDVYLY